MRRVLVLGFLTAACAATPPAATPERVADLRARAKACHRHLPSDYRYEVDRFGSVRVTGPTSGTPLQTAAFNDCIFGAGQWKDPVARPPAAAPPVAVPVTPPAPAVPSRTADRLKELDALRQQRLITEEEYQTTRKRILEGL
jgi:hypothetical protein